MTIIAPNTFNPDKRQHLRVPFQRSVKLSNQEVTQGSYSSENLSLGGIYLAGSAPLPVGVGCRIELHASGRQASLLYHVCGTIVHRDGKGFGVRFADMEERCFTFLQTMVLYGSDDPIATAEHFIDGLMPVDVARC